MNLARTYEQPAVSGACLTNTHGDCRGVCAGAVCGCACHRPRHPAMPQQRYRFIDSQSQRAARLIEPDREAWALNEDACAAYWAEVRRRCTQLGSTLDAFLAAWRTGLDATQDQLDRLTRGTDE